MMCWVSLVDRVWKDSTVVLISSGRGILLTGMVQMLSMIGLQGHMTITTTTDEYRWNLMAMKMKAVVKVHKPWFLSFTFVYHVNHSPSLTSSSFWLFFYYQLATELAEPVQQAVYLPGPAVKHMTTCSPTE